MRHARISSVIVTTATLLSTLITASPASPPTSSADPIKLLTTSNANISIPLFIALEELSRIVDISYCVGTSGITHPFECASRCDEFPNFELVREFNTGPLLSDSCGYVVLDHGNRGSRGREQKEEHYRHAGGKTNGRIIVAFRGTYSIANTIVDLSTVPQEYAPYPGSPKNDSSTHAPPKQRKHHRLLDWIPGFKSPKDEVESSENASAGKEMIKCNNCTVHSGFWQSWQNTRSYILPHLEAARTLHPDYQLHLVGHSLGGAVAALAGLEMDALGWDPIITTFGEPKVGNAGLRRFIDQRFDLPFGNETVPSSGGTEMRYRRVTHVDDPVPLLPLLEWGYKPHAGEVFISKPALQPGLSDVRLCNGDEDTDCSFGAEATDSWLNGAVAGLISASSLSPSGSNQQDVFPPDLEDVESFQGEAHPPIQQSSSGAVDDEAELELKKRWGIPIPSRYKMWQLFFAHRDYFWRLGLCVKGGDPSDWGRDKYRFPGQDDDAIPQ